MAKLNYENGTTSVILRIKIMDTASTTGGGKTGLTNSSTGLIIAVIADNEATTTVYTVAASNVETITTLGTYAAPSTNKCRFKEVDATNHPGLYELHIADTRWAVSNARSVIVTISGASGAAQVDAEIQLRNLPANILGINSNITSPIILDRSARAIARSTVGSSSTTTSIITSSLDPAATISDQFKGRLVVFDRDTTTTALRGQATNITASDASGVLTVTALTTAPASGDTFTIN